MIKVKHMFDMVESDDGQRIWVEPIGLTRDLREWCSIDQVDCQLGPPRALWEWFGQHPDGYEYFRSCYHQMLDGSPLKQTLQAMACKALRDNFTLIHQGDDPEHNSASALYEFLSELEAYCPPE